MKLFGVITFALSISFVKAHSSCSDNNYWYEKYSSSFSNDLIYPQKVAVGGSVTITCDYRNISKNALGVSLIRLDSKRQIMIEDCGLRYYNYEGRVAATGSCDPSIKYYQWRLSSATTKDTGCMFCQFQVEGISSPTSPEAFIMNYTYLQVLNPPSTPIITFPTHKSTTTYKVEVKKGSSITLNCSHTNDEPVDYIWQKNKGDTISTSMGLTINSTTVESRGSYTCSVSNGIGYEISGPVFMDVIYLPDMITISSTPSSPVKAETLVTFTCLATQSNPLPDIHLFRNDTKIFSEMGKYSLTKSVILSRRFWYSEFKCSATSSNELMKSESVESSMNAYQIYALPSKLSLLSQPTFPVTNGTEVSLDCIATIYNPKPDLTLFKEDKELKKVFSTNFVKFKKELQIDDNEKRFRCVATSSVPVLRGFHVSSPLLKAHVQYKPIILEHFYNIDSDVDTSHNAAINIKINANPKPTTVYCEKNDNGNIMRKHLENIRVFDTFSTWKISNTSNGSINGTWQCITANVIGMTTFSVDTERVEENEEKVQVHPAAIAVPIIVVFLGILAAGVIVIVIFIRRRRPKISKEMAENKGNTNQGFATTDDENNVSHIYENPEVKDSHTYMNMENMKDHHHHDSRNKIGAAELYENVTAIKQSENTTSSGSNDQL